MVYLPSDSLIISNADKIIAALNKHKIPSYGAVESLVQKGAMVGIVSSYEKVGKALAEKVIKVLDGTPPSKIPSSYLPHEMQTIVVNAKTAQKIEASIPFEILSSAKILE